MRTFFKKTILLFTLTGVVFLGGGVGVVRAATEDTSGVLTGVDQSTVEARSTLSGIGCGGWKLLTEPITCGISLITYRLYQVVSLILLLSGSIFDFMLTLSIDKGFIDQPFVDFLWKMVRDFSNMMFIFALLYAGIRTMLLGDDWGKPVMMVVVIALLINFSLFFTKIVIDAGNTLALGVYSSMGNPKATGSHKIGGEPEHNISETLVEAFAPQSFLKLSGGQQDLAPTIFIIAGVISGFVAWIFFKAAFVFMGRLLAFWFLMIFSPFAFITLVFPQLAAKFKFSFSAWIDMLVNQAFVAPVFLLFIYIIMYIIKAGLFAKFGEPTGAGFFFDMIFIPIVKAVMIVYALKKALSIAESMSGEFGEIGANIGNKVLGLAVTGGASMALGGTAMGLRATLGQDAHKVLESGILQRKAAEGGIRGFIARQRLAFAGKAATGSFDIRETGIAKKAIKAAGIDVGKVSKEATGGWVAVQKKREEDDKKKAEKHKVTDTERETKAAEINPEYSKAKGRAEKEYQTERKATLEYTDAEASMSKSKMAGDDIIKKIERLKREQMDAEKNYKSEEVERLENEIRKAQTEHLAQKDLENDLQEMVNEKKTALEDASKKYRETREIIRNTEKELGDWENATNERRREQIGYAQTWPRFYYSKADREANVKKIRAAKTKEDRLKEKKEKDFLKNLIKVTEKETKEEEKKEEPKEEKKEGEESKK